MDKMQNKEWAKAQEIQVSVDLVEAAKKQLHFLSVVDRNRYLYQEDHALKWAIYRYNACWLPLLAKHLENPVSEDPLVVPLDCEWIWHCHRLNPISYKVDCQKLYGKILGNRNVISSVQATSKSATEEIWNKMYPEEPYKLDINRPFSEDIVKNHPENDKFTSYDLVAAAKRQSSFTFQVSRPHMSDDLFLQEAEARYKGFLHLIRTNTEMGVNSFCVPTYDVDLMWHTHLLYPGCYCKDLIKLMGRVLQHDDTDSDRSKGGKLDTGYSETTKQFEETFGKRYWKAGTLNRGNTPTPVTQVPSEFKYEGKETSMKLFDKPMQLSARQAVEVFLEFVEIRNLPEVHNDNLVVSFSKKQSDKLFDIKRSLSIFSESGEKQVAYFQCEPTGDFLFELQSQSPSDELKSISSKVLGTCSLSLQELVSSPSQLSADKWLSVDPVSGLDISEPILLHVAVSFTLPTPVPQVFHLDSTQHALPSILKTGKDNLSKTQTYVTDDDGKEVFSLEMRNIGNDARKCAPESLKEVHLITGSGEKHIVAEFLENNWFINGMGLFKAQNNPGNADHLFELVGNKMVKLFRGRRLEFEPKHCGNQRCEQDFISFVEFSGDHPYGKSIALIDLKLGTVKAVDEWIVVPGIIIGFILAETIVDECNEDKGTAAWGSSDATPCAGGRCGGEENMAKCGGGYCSGGGCGGGRCTGKIENNINSSACGGGKCGGGNCGGGSCGGGRCSGKVENNINSSACGGGKCGGGKCGGGKCGGMVDSGIYSSVCGGGKCGSGKCGGGKCGGYGIEDYSGGNDMPKVASSIMNEPLAVAA